MFTELSRKLSINFRIKWYSIMPKKYALIVGISDYRTISDLNFCDEDATDWYQYLKANDYEIVLLGDAHRKNYPKYDGLATEATVRMELKKMLNKAENGDTLVFITSGHGHGDGRGSSFLCMVNCNPARDVDCYRDTELLADLKSIKKQPNIFIFIDHCFSGGFLDQLKPLRNVACFTTCSQNGFGYDSAPHRNGAWTYTFLEKGLIQQFGGKAPIEQVYSWANANYQQLTGQKTPNDMPQKINNLPPSFTL